MKLHIDIIFHPEFQAYHPMEVQEHLDHLRSVQGHPDLSRAYNDIPVLNTTKREYSRNLAVKTLRWMLASFKPLTVGSLVQAVALTSDGQEDPDVSEEFVLHICPNFIWKTDIGIMKFTHKSVKDHLRQSDLPEEFKGEFSMDKCHPQVAETCINFLLTLNNDSKWGHLPVLSDIKPSAIIKVTSFELYTCLFWAKHCGRMEGLRESGSSKNKFYQLIGGRGTAIASVAFQKWNSLLTRYSSSVEDSECRLEGILRRQLGDSLSARANPMFAACILDFQR